MTQAGIILGTAADMSPEQAKGKPVDKRADIWAFGCVLYEMLTGARAFDGEDITDTLALVLRGQPDWARLPSSLPAPLLTLVKRCLERDVKRRIGDMSAVRFVLDELGTLSAPPAAGGVDPLPAEARVAVAAHEHRWLVVLRAVAPLAAVALASAVIAVFAYQRMTPAEPREIVRFRLPLPEGQVMSLARRVAALSPDGRDLAYVTDRQLFVRRLSEFEAMPVTAVEAGQSISSPTYSPDGAWLAFHSGTERAIKRVSTRGGAPVRVCEVAPPSTLAWDASGLLIGAAQGGIQRCDPAGGQPETLVAAADGEALIAPQILPGGKTIIFTVGKVAEVPAVRWDRSSVVAHSLETGERRTIVPTGSDGRYLESGHLVYRAGGILYAARFDPDTLALQGEPAPVIEGIMYGTSGGTQMTIAPNGTLVYMPGQVGMNPNERELALGDRQGVITRLPLPAGPYVHVLTPADGKVAPLGGITLREPTGAAFSPDGRWFAYTATPGDDVSAVNRGIFVQAFPPNGATFQAPRQLVDFHPMWDADGKEIVWLASTAARQMAATRVTVDGGLTFGTPVRFPASVTGDRLSAEPRSFDLLPDGRLIGVVTRTDSGRSVYTDLRVVINWFEELKARVPVR